MQDFLYKNMNKLLREILITLTCLILGYMLSQYFLKDYRAGETKSEVSISK